ncbi:MAG: hypothetical protein AAF416_17610 [Pseudomonadota bacterium]
MGGVVSNTNITADVFISKDVNIDIFKNVVTNVELNGDFADAEAAADASFAPGDDAGSGGLVRTFLIDDFLSDQEVTAGPGAVVGPNSVVMIAAETDFAAGTTRDVTVDNTGSQSNATFRSNQIPSHAEFSNDALTDAIITVEYDPAGVVDILGGSSSAGAGLHLTGIDSDLGAEIMITIIDGDGDEFSETVAVPTTGPEDVFVPFSDFDDQNAAGDGALDLTMVDQIILVEEGETSNDTILDLVEVLAPADVPGNVLAETFTAAQVSPGLATSYSQAIAAFDPGFSSDPMDMM